MKRRALPKSMVHDSLVLALALAWLSAGSARANVTVTAPTGGSGLSADSAQNGATPTFTALGDLIIQEQANGDFPLQTNKTLILSAPSGWRFNAGAGGAL